MFNLVQKNSLFRLDSFCRVLTHRHPKRGNAPYLRGRNAGALVHAAADSERNFDFDDTAAQSRYGRKSYHVPDRPLQCLFRRSITVGAANFPEFAAA